MTPSFNRVPAARPNAGARSASPSSGRVGEERTLLDVGCANGYLLECLVQRGQERGLKLTPHGVDLSPRLIALARERLSAFERHFFVANAWDWHPPRRFRYVYARSDCVPEDYLEAFAERLLSRVVEPGSTLVLGSYGSRSRGVRPLDLRVSLTGTGLWVQGSRFRAP